VRQTAILRRQFSEKVCDAAHCKSDRVREAFYKVAREQFFERGPWLVYQFAPQPPYFNYVSTLTNDLGHLYEDVSIALDAEKNINCGLPSVWAGWLDVLALKPGERVLHVGSGVGYYSAVMAEMVGATGAVYAVEVDPRLARLAEERLRDHPVVRPVHGDGAIFDAGSVDAVVVSAGVTDVPALWLNRLRPGGRLLLTLSFTDDKFPDIGLGLSFLVTHCASDGFTARHLSFPYIYSCTSLRTAQQSRRISQAIDAGGWEPVRSLRRDAHAHESSCWLHMETWCLSCRTPGEPTDPTGAARAVPMRQGPGPRMED